jgi:hypothetical protein
MKSAILGFGCRSVTISLLFLTTVLSVTALPSRQLPSTPSNGSVQDSRAVTTSHQSRKHNRKYERHLKSQHAFPPPVIPLPVFTDVSPGAGARLSTWQSSTGRIHSITQNGNRLYAAAPRAGLWRSSDGGVTWSQLNYPLSVVQAGQALPGPVVIDVSVDPDNPDRVLAVSKFNDFYRAGDAVDGLYLSTDAGGTWRFVHHAKDCSGNRAAIEGVAFVSSSLAVTWGGCEVAFSTDGVHWRSSALGTRGETITQVVVDPNNRTGYACGFNSAGNPAPFWRTNNLTNSNWTRFQYTLSETSTENWCGGIQSQIEGAGGYWHALALNPWNNRILYVSTYGANNDSRIWRIDLTRTAPFPATPLPRPSDPSSGSGVVYVLTKAHQSPSTPGFLIFFATTNRLFVSDGEPSGPGSWLVMDQTLPFQLHVDTHALALSKLFDMQLSGGANPATRSACSGGTIWAANDGGVYKSGDCGQTWTRAEGGKLIAGTGGLSILYPLLIGVAASPGKAPVLAIGTGDNGDFYSLDGGESWAEPNQSRESDCSDCADWFVDLLDPTWIMTMARAPGGGNKVRLYSITEDDVSRTRSLNLINAGIYKGPQSVTVGLGDASSQFYGLGDATTPARPVIQTLPSELGTNFPRNDVAMVTCCTTSASDPAGVATLIRTNDPCNPSAARVIGTLPRGNWVVQSSGGHTNTFYFIWNTMTKTLRQRDSSGNEIILLPAPGAARAARYFINPYDPTEIYIVESSSGIDSAGHQIPEGVKRWVNGHWAIDEALTTAATNNRKFTMGCSSFPSCLINDMIFVPGEQTRFIAGKAGVFYSLDGRTWRRLFTTEEIPSVPSALAFDKYARSLYVGLNGRGMIRFDRIPSPEGRVTN